MRLFPAPHFLAASFAVVALLLSACQAPRKTESFTARPKVDPNAAAIAGPVQPADAAPAKRSEKFTAQPKQAPIPGNEMPSGPYAAPEPISSPALVGDLEIHFIKVGQGDSTLVKFPNGNTLLVDGGSLKDRAPGALRSYLLSEVSDGSIETLVITHPDADHYNCLPYATSGLSIGQVLFVGTTAEYSADANVSNPASMTSKGFKTWLDGLPASKRKRLTTSDIDAQGSPSNALFSSGDVNVWIVAADVQDGTDKNSRSITLLVSYGDFDCLLTGDATFKTEQAIVAKYDAWWLDLDCLKLGHHGSRWTSTSQDWVNVVKPELAISSASLTAMHGHPSDALRTRLEPFTESSEAHKIKWWTSKDAGAMWSGYTEAIYSTATNGTIVISTDGASFDVNYADN